MRFRRMLRPAALASGILLLLTGCASEAINLITTRSGYATVTDIAYGPDPRQRYDLYTPDGVTGTTPLVVFIHGGSWDTGSKDIYRFVGQALTAQGFIVAIPDYRLYPDVTFPAFVEDGAAAFAAIDKAMAEGSNGIPAGVRPVALMGHSAGAEIAALLAFDARYLKAAGSSRARLSAFVGLAGPYDFLPLTEERYKRIFPPATRDESQPINYADGKGPPALLIHGTADTTVDPKNSISMADKIKRNGGTVDLRLIDGADHITPISSFVTVLPVGNKDIRQSVIRFLQART